jgi:hypothetical protein
MKKYSYKIEEVLITVFREGEENKMLKEAGNDGWELVSVTPGGNTAYRRFYFKKEIPNVYGGG